MQTSAVQCSCQSLTSKDELKTPQTSLYEGAGRQSGRLASLMLSALGHGVQRVGILHCGDICSRLYFPSLTGSTSLATMLPIPVVSLESTHVFSEDINKEKQTCSLEPSKRRKQTRESVSCKNSCRFSFFRFLHFRFSRARRARKSLGI